MVIKPGQSALVTGGSSGIGKSLSLALGQKGVFVTIVDLCEKNGTDICKLVQKENDKFHQKLAFPSSIFIKCDVSDSSGLKSAFAKHLKTYGGLDICINNAGIINTIPFGEDQTNGSGSWRLVLNVNLISLIDSTHIAIQIMQATKKPGVIINMSSAAGLYPLYHDPIYGASKGGIVMFTRSLAPFTRQGIRINALCPEYVETEMGLKSSSKLVDSLGGYVSMKMVVKGAFELIEDESKFGKCIWITKRKGMEYWPTPFEEQKYLVKKSSSKKSMSSMFNSNLSVPESFDKLIVHTLSHNFRAATSIIRAPLRLPTKQNHILLKIIYAGVNASDVNFTSGRYFLGDNNDVANHLPFDAGFEAVGIIADVGDYVTNLKVGTPAAVMAYGSYAEFIMVPSKHILPVAWPEPEVVAMLTSGLTASIALDKAGHTQSGKKVLVTAAAGGTGQFAIQLAKLSGNTVVAACGGKEKALLLKDLGVDRVIDYTSEDIKAVLKKEFPSGLDIIYESVGGKMFDLCLNALAVYGNLIVIGMVSQYQREHGWKPSSYTGLCEKILTKSQTISGFFLLQHSHMWQEHLDKLFYLFSSGSLKVFVDPKKFFGLHSIPDAVEHLHSGKSMGKVVVCIDPSFSCLAKL